MTPNKPIERTPPRCGAAHRRVRATLRVPRTAPRLSLVVRDAKRVTNQRLHNLRLLRACR